MRNLRGVGFGYHGQPAPAEALPTAADLVCRGQRSTLGYVMLLA